VTSREQRDNWNAIDPNFIIDEDDQPWLVWGSFWDGIQMARLDTTMHLAKGEIPRTIARRYSPKDLNRMPNPTSQYAGTNAIEAPFIMRHGGYYYLFVSWDYCCMGSKSTYRVVVGRSKTVDGPYVDRDGEDMREGGGTPVIAGDKKEFEALGHCAAYHYDDKDIFICHGYSIAHNGASILVQRPIRWTADGWPEI
jgi:arabinan endo-1,5-alpha-L-arabinosidase